MSLDGSKFLAALVNDNLGATTESEEKATNGIILAGMVRLVEGENNRIQFSPGANGLHWFDLPIEIIEEVEPLGKAPYGGHQYDLVLLQMKVPSTPESKLLTDLLQYTSELLEDINETTGVDSEAISGEPELLPTREVSLAGFRIPRPHFPPMIPPTVPKLIIEQVDRVSHFSKCAKCKMYVELTLAALIAGAFAAAGVTGPSYYQALKLALEKEFGEAAVTAVWSALISHNNKGAAKIICSMQGKC